MTSHRNQTSSIPLSGPPMLSRATNGASTAPRLAYLASRGLAIALATTIIAAAPPAYAHSAQALFNQFNEGTVDSAWNVCKGKLDNKLKKGKAINLSEYGLDLDHLDLNSKGVYSLALLECVEIFGMHFDLY
ncbi:hypothetical protein NKI51_28905 [Mesorhizobium australicum]|uniref:hypothetical protein n=1 Tax=Mesorhizobium australicum TaxID=536018 RepID=UPI0033387E74